MIKLAKTFVEYLNSDVLKEHLDLCHKLELDQLNSVYQVDSYLDTIKPKKKKLTNWERTHLLQPPAIELNYKKYLFQVQTKPNNGIYEFNLLVENKINKAQSKRDFSKLPKLSTMLISRINKYGNDEHCIHDTFPDLRKFCYCRKTINGKITA